MFHKSPQSLGSVLSSLIDTLGIQRKLNEARAVEGWAVLAGNQINAVTDSVWIKGDKLFVKITSAAWRQELYLRRREWCERLNEHLGSPIVSEIVFR